METIARYQSHHICGHGDPRRMTFGGTDALSGVDGIPLWLCSVAVLAFLAFGMALGYVFFKRSLQ